MWVLGVLFALSLALWMWQVVAGWLFPLHRRLSSGQIESLPSVSLLKPLKNRDPETNQCLESWFRQDYPCGWEILFGVDSANDPVCELVHELIRRYPLVSARLIVCPNLGLANGKIGKLVELARNARYDVWVVSDADVWAPADYVTESVAFLKNEKAGLVHALYRLKCPLTPPMQWEAVGVNVDFWCQVLQARQLRPFDFALGAALVTTREGVEAIGGFRALGNYLADDYHLGHELSRRGAKIKLGYIPVTCHEPSSTWAEVWQHQLRWARTIRICKPWPYFMSILNNVTLWACLWGGSGMFWRSGVGQNPSIMLGGVPWAIDWCTLLWVSGLSLRIGLGLALNWRFTGAFLPLRFWGMILLKDMLQFFLWVMAFAGNQVVWRQERFKVSSDGQMQSLGPAALRSNDALPSCPESMAQSTKRP